MITHKITFALITVEFFSYPIRGPAKSDIAILGSTHPALSVCHLAYTAAKTGSQVCLTTDSEEIAVPTEVARGTNVFLAFEKMIALAIIPRSPHTSQQLVMKSRQPICGLSCPKDKMPYCLRKGSYPTGFT